MNLIISFYIRGSEEGPLEVDGAEVWKCYLNSVGNQGKVKNNMRAKNWEELRFQ